MGCYRNDSSQIDAWKTWLYLICNPQASGALPTAHVYVMGLMIMPSTWCMVCDGFNDNAFNVVHDTQRFHRC
jgi:hypothetical protein